MIKIITFTGKNLLISNTLDRSAKYIEKNAENYFWDATLITDSKPFTSIESRFDSPYALVNIPEQKILPVTEDIQGGFHFNYFG